MKANTFTSVKKVVAPSEIEISRKLYRNGETEYRINGEACRRRDIQEVFMDTGAGAKSYSVIAQGEIDRIVKAKPEERRVMIEEVAGVTKFKMRKKESLRKIEKTRDNLSRIHDLGQEIGGNLLALEEQSNKAEEARKLKQDIISQELIINSHKVYNVLSEYMSMSGKLLDTKSDLVMWQTKKDKLEIKLEENKLNREEQIEKVNVIKEKHNTASLNLATSEERINGLNREIQEKHRQIGVYKDDITELENNLSNRLDRLSKLRQERDHHYGGCSEEGPLLNLEKSLDEIKSKLAAEEGTIKSLEERMANKKEEYVRANREVDSIQTRSSDLASNLGYFEGEITSLQSRESKLSDKSGTLKLEVEGLNKRADDLELEEAKIRKDISSSKQELSELEDKFEDGFKNEVKLESKLNSLQEINETEGAIKEGNKDFLSSVAGEGFSLLGNIVKTSPKYAMAVDSLLGPLSEVPVSIDGTFGEIKKWSADNPDKGIDFLHLLGGDAADSSAKEALKRAGVGDLKSLAEVLELSHTGGELGSFFAGFYLVEKLDWDVYERLDPDLNFKAIADFSGQVVVSNISGARVFSSGRREGSGQSIIERNHLIEDIGTKLDVLRGAQSQLKIEVNSKSEHLSSLEKKADLRQEELASVRSELAMKNSSLQSATESLDEVRAGLEGLMQKKLNVEQELKNLSARREELSDNMKNMKEELLSIDSSISLHSSEAEEQRALHQEERDRLLTLRAENRSMGVGISTIEKQIEDVESQVAQEKSRIRGNTDRMTALQEDSSKLESQLKELEVQNGNMVEELQEEEKIIVSLDHQLEKLVQEIDDQIKELSKIDKNINSGEKSAISLMEKINRHIEDEEQVTRNIFEKYRIDLRESIGAFLGCTEADYQSLADLSDMYIQEMDSGVERVGKKKYSFVLLKPEELKRGEASYNHSRRKLDGLGEINWQATSDYERQKQRYEFLQEQERELEHSLDDLRSAIEHIDEKSRVRFGEAFAEVSTCFERMFPLIFGGGNASLSIRGDINDPECGVEIIAQPPGKRMQSINLMSGGEKALTAVVLIFSIFLVKPSPFCLLDEVDAPLDDVNVARFNDVLRSMSDSSQFILITHNKKTMSLNDRLYGITMQEPGISKAVSVQLQ